jgi:hypothetical protein
MEIILIEVKHFSISQLNKYEECPRKHFYQYVLKEESPSSDAQEYGKKCHSYLEMYLNGEIDVFPTDWHGKTCTAALPYLPSPKSGYVEKYFELELQNLVAPIIGYMDYCSYSESVEKAILLDHKIVSSDQYLLTPEKLAKTNQIITYSKYILDQCDAESIEASYLYVKRGGSWAKKVTVELDRNQVNKSFQNVANGFEMLQKNYTTTNEENVPQILSACEKWGGCPFKDRCWGTQKGDNMNLLDRLKSVKVDTSADDQKSSNEGSQNVFKMISNAKTATSESKGRDNQDENILADDNQGQHSNQLLDAQETETDSEDVAEDSLGEEDENNVNYFQLAADSEPVLHVLTTANAPVRVDLNTLDDFDLSDLAERASQQLANFSNLSKTSSQEADLDLLESIRLDVFNDNYEEDVIEYTPSETPTQSDENQEIAKLQDDGLVVVAQDQETKITSDDKPSPAGWDFYEVNDTHDTWMDRDIAYIEELSNRTKNSLKKHGFLNLRTVLAEYPNPDDLLNAEIKGFGQGSVEDLKSFLTTRNYLQANKKYPQPSLLEIVKEKEVLPVQTNTDVAVPIVQQNEEKVSKVVETVKVEETPKLATQQITEPAVIAQPTQKQEPSISLNNILLLGVQPMKGMQFIYFEDFIAPLEEEIARVNDVPHICMMNFAKGYDILTGMVRQGVLQKKLDWSVPIYVSTQAQITYAKAISVLIQNASLVLKNV